MRCVAHENKSNLLEKVSLTQTMVVLHNFSEGYSYYSGAIIISDAPCRRGYINSRRRRLRMSCVLAEATGLALVTSFNQ